FRGRLGEGAAKEAWRIPGEGAFVQRSCRAHGCSARSVAGSCARAPHHSCARGLIRLAAGNGSPRSTLPPLQGRVPPSDLTPAPRGTVTKGTAEPGTIVCGSLPSHFSAAVSAT